MLKIKYNGDNVIEWGQIAALTVDESNLMVETTDEVTFCIHVFDSYSDAIEIKTWIEAVQATIPNVGGGGTIIIDIEDF